MKLPVVPEGLSTSRKGDRNMKDKQVKLPGPEHPISIQRNPARVVVSVAGRVIADTRNALTLREAAYLPVQYIPSEDVDFSQLERTEHVSYCPYKGDCNYYNVAALGKKSVNAVWSYEDPFAAVAQIKGHVAFYPGRVDENSGAASQREKRLTGSQTLQESGARFYLRSPHYIQHSAHIAPGREEWRSHVRKDFPGLI
jgi:uncharacterized protein (DUF427 family)